MFKSGFIHWLIFWIALIGFFAFARFTEAQATSPYYQYGTGNVDDAMRNYYEHERWTREQERDYRIERLEREQRDYRLQQDWEKQRW